MLANKNKVALAAKAANSPMKQKVQGNVRWVKTNLPRGAKTCKIFGPI